MQQKIQDRLVSSMKAKDKKLITVLRDIKNNLNESYRIKKEDLNEQDCFNILTKMSKKLKQSIEAYGEHLQYREAKQLEEYELRIIDEYLPNKMTIDEIQTSINKIINTLDISHGVQNLGNVMKAFNKQHLNQDGKIVSKYVRERLSI